MVRKASVANLLAGVLLAVALHGSTSSPASVQERLPDAGCAAEDSFRSTEGSTPAEITFVNHSARAIRTYWLNYQGKRVYYAEIQPGKRLAQQTYFSHPWVITGSASGECIAIFLPAQKPGVATID
jgi:hypothetical protein